LSISKYDYGRMTDGFRQR